MIIGAMSSLLAGRLSWPKMARKGCKAAQAAPLSTTLVRTYFDPDQEHNRNRASQLLQPVNLLPHGTGSAAQKKVTEDTYTSKSSRLLQDNGLVRSAYPGVFTYLPLATRSLEKLTKLVDESMRQDAGGQKIILPTLTEASHWKKTGRLETMKSELMTTTDRSDNLLVLSPTHEEAVTRLMAELGPATVSYKSLPLRLYQITSKFRDEMKPRFGLIRSREFLMKDMYTFDTDITSALETYEAVNEAYKRFFRKLMGNTVEMATAARGTSTSSEPGGEVVQLPALVRRVVGDTGDIGGQRSHEFHLLADIGQDDLLVCPDCERGNNLEVDGRKNIEECSACGGRTELRASKGIEVAHAFLLGDKYSAALGAKYRGLDGKPHDVFMGCYGIGVSRLMAACVEALSSDKELRWPTSIVPFSVCVICPKAGSREASCMEDAYALYDALNGRGGLFENDALLDEREKVTVGRKLRDAYKTGYTYVVLFGKDCIDKADPKVELHCLFNQEPQVLSIRLEDIVKMLAYFQKKTNSQ